MDDEHNKDNVLVYGIVTNALEWIFIRWIGSPNNPKVKMSGLHHCGIADDIVNIKQIVNYIISILQNQLRGINNGNKKIRK